MQEIVIVGGGISGLACGLRLSEANYKVTVLEKNETVGGLARSFAVNGKWLPLTYHHVMLPDKTTLEYTRKYGFGHLLKWIRSNQVFWYDSKPYPLSQPHHILTFRPLGLADKMRLFYLGLYVFFKRNWENLSSTSCKDWLEKTAGKKNTEMIFQPLMDIKFNMPLSGVSAAWLGGRMHQSVRNRDRYGYPGGGWQNLFETMAEMITERGGRIVRKCEATGINDGEVEAIAAGKKTSYRYDSVVSTIPPPLLNPMLRIPGIQKNPLTTVKYKALISFICSSPQKLSREYWVVVLKPSLIFGGFFNFTVLAPQECPPGQNIYYFFTYTENDDPILDSTEEELKNVYLKDIRKIFPDFSINWYRIFKLKFSQPVFFRDYENPPLELAENFYLAGIYRQYPKPRTMDAAFYSGRETAEYIINKHAKT